MTTLRVGTRGSQLALWQAGFVADAIYRAGGPACELVIIKTSGDRFAEAPLARIGGKRLFVKEIEDALLAGDVDLAVHSAKDLPADLPPGTVLAGVPGREDPRDAIVLPGPRSAAGSGSDDLDEQQLMALFSLKGQRPRIGTSSVRRTAQLVRILRGAQFEGIRGNLDTRLRKLDAGGYDALVLAAAGLRRLGFAGRIAATLSLEICMPAPGQGAIAVETRADDAAVRTAVERISTPDMMAAVIAERTVVAGLGGGCQAPIGAIARTVGNDLRLQAVATSLDGQRVTRHSAVGPASDPVALGGRVAEALLADGAGALLEEARRAQAPPEGSP